MSMSRRLTTLAGGASSVESWGLRITEALNSERFLAQQVRFVLSSTHVDHCR